MTVSRVPDSNGGSQATFDLYHAAALTYLERFATSAENLRRVLRRRAMREARRAGGQPDWDAVGPIIETVIARLTKAGLLDDWGYAGLRAEALHRRGEPARRIRARLAAKGIAREAIDAAIGSIETRDPDAAFRAACRLVLRRRIGPCRAAGRGAGPGGRHSRSDRELAALARAGFDYETCRRVLELPDEAAVRRAIADDPNG